MSLRVLLISTYELGRQPFGLASPAAWLRAEGAEVSCLDLFIERFDEERVAQADLIAFYVPMHTATRIAAPLIQRARRLNPGAQICCYGLYASVNASFLRKLGADTIIGGEFEQALLDLYRRLSVPVENPPQEVVSLARQEFRVPDRSGLPSLQRYARLHMPGEESRVAGYTEASRGCRHRCRHCPIVPVYEGRFRIVAPDVVLADIAHQVEAGAHHISFGDPDFFNGPTHALRVVRALHERFPDLSYDVTIKIEHLLNYARLLPELRDTGCVLITSAVESVDDAILAKLDKGHTRADFVRAVGLLREVGIPMQPTFVAFNPWISPHGYCDLLHLLAELDLIESVPPIQLAIRLLIPTGSKLLELPEVQSLVGPFDPAALCYAWSHADPCVDSLQERVLAIVKRGSDEGIARRQIFAEVWRIAHEGVGAQHNAAFLAGRNLLASRLVPWLSEPWYC